MLPQRNIFSYGCKYHKSFIGNEYIITEYNYKTYVWITNICLMLRDVYHNNNRLYNMVCSALFLQRALYTVHCTIQCTLESRRLWPPQPFLVNAVNRYFVIYAILKYATFYWNNFIWFPLIYRLSKIHVLALVHKAISISSSTDP